MDRGNLAVRLAAAGVENGDRIATRVAEGDGWRTATYEELWGEVRRVAALLVRSGIQRGDRVAIFAPNLPEWTVADLAVLTAGAVVVPLYATSGESEVRHVLADAGCVAAFVASGAELAVIPRAELPDLRLVVSFADAGADIPTLAGLPDPSAAEEAEIDTRLSAATADDLASLIYTSGTTGVPKGVMLTHRGFTFQVDSLDQFFDVTADDHSLCFLPLSHALERAWTFFVLAHGCMNTYWPDPRTVADGMVAARPTLLVSVPRLYEKVFAVAHQRVRGSAFKRAVFGWAMGVGTRAQDAYLDGRRPGAWTRAQVAVADVLVFRAIRDAIGGPKTVLACGGAPLRRDVQQFFSACGIQLLSGYGLTEASPLVSFDAPAAWRVGASGRVVPGGEIRIGDGGEICYRGPNVMAGYWGMPEETARVLRDGWLHTGDVGHLDEDGFLLITDRIKDLIVTSNGKNIAPAPIEGMVLADPLFEYAMLLGDNRPYVTLLVSPSLPNLEELAKQLQLTWSKREELFELPEILEETKRRIAELTERLAHHEQIKDVRIVSDEFSTESGLLTPTLKVKRKEVEHRFHELIDEMYTKFDGRKR
ncbi:AMP-dependent synthetase/ligase [Propionicicella superfundia]|uniref:AMP-dependent synthetase/ligase n=1 Tax=Propionicicella superfundia TaxID=348582 RepID=UPI00041BCDF5|nr:long-chain fatty acid--CoA ligase [Propionicicella superfundia]